MILFFVEHHVMIRFVAMDHIPLIILTPHLPNTNSTRAKKIPSKHLTALLTSHVCLARLPPLQSLTRTGIAFAVPTPLASLALVFSPRLTMLLLEA